MTLGRAGVLNHDCRLVDVIRLVASMSAGDFVTLTQTQYSYDDNKLKLINATASTTAVRCFQNIFSLTNQIFKIQFTSTENTQNVLNGLIMCTWPVINPH